MNNKFKNHLTLLGKYELVFMKNKFKNHLTSVTEIVKIEWSPVMVFLILNTRCRMLINIYFKNKKVRSRKVKDAEAAILMVRRAVNILQKHSKQNLKSLLVPLTDNMAVAKILPFQGFGSHRI